MSTPERGAQRGRGGNASGRGRGAGRGRGIERDAAALAVLKEVKSVSLIGFRTGHYDEIYRKDAIALSPMEFAVTLVKQTFATWGLEIKTSRAAKPGKPGFDKVHHAPLPADFFIVHRMFNMLNATNLEFKSSMSNLVVPSLVSRPIGPYTTYGRSFFKVGMRTVLDRSKALSDVAEKVHQSVNEGNDNTRKGPDREPLTKVIIDWMATLDANQTDFWRMVKPDVEEILTRYKELEDEVLADVDLPFITTLINNRWIDMDDRKAAMPKRGEQLFTLSAGLATIAIHASPDNACGMRIHPLELARAVAARASHTQELWGLKGMRPGWRKTFATGMLTLRREDKKIFYELEKELSARVSGKTVLITTPKELYVLSGASDHELIFNLSGTGSRSLTSAAFYTAAPIKEKSGPKRGSSSPAGGETPPAGGSEAATVPK